jgi:phosphate uptake regulator
VCYRRIRLKNRSGLFPEDLVSGIRYFCQRKLRFVGAPQSVNAEVIIDMGSPSDFLMKNRIDKLQEQTVEIHKELQNLVESFNDAEARLAINRDDEVDKICHEVVRLCKLAAQNPLLVKRMGLENYRSLMGFRIIARRIERCADLACYAIHELLRLYEKEKKVKFNKRTKQIIVSYSNKVLDVFNQTIDALFALEKDERYETADELIEQIDSIDESLEKIALQTEARSETPEEFYCRRRILDALKRTGEYVKTMLEVLENMSIEAIIEECETT